MAALEETPACNLLLLPSLYYFLTLDDNGVALREHWVCIRSFGLASSITSHTLPALGRVSVSSDT